MFFHRCPTAGHREKLINVNTPQSTSLQELIDLAMAQRGSTSVRHLTQLAKDQGFKVVHTTLGQIRNGTYKYTPRSETLQAIAWLAKVDVSVAFAAAGQPVPGPPLADELPPGADNLSPKARKALIDLARLLIEYEADQDNAQLSNPSPADAKPGTLRAVAREGDPRPGQKTEPDHGIIELRGDEARAVPVPPRDKLAAHPKVKTMREQIDVHDSMAEGALDDE